MKNNNIKTGSKGEEEAIKYLIKGKYKILERNFKTKVGEIDIIAEKDGYIVFIEVKKRSSKAFGYGYEAVDVKKQQKIIKTANLYISYQKKESKCRFDVISIDENNINHIENAFEIL